MSLNGKPSQSEKRTREVRQRENPKTSENFGLFRIMSDFGALWGVGVDSRSIPLTGGGLPYTDNLGGKVKLM